MTMKQGKHIFLIGFMGCGKTTNAKQLAGMTGRTWLEMDEEIVKDQKMEITDIFEKFGQEYFRELETSLLRGMGRREAAVVSCGGGAILRDQNVSLMRETGTVVLLTAKPETVYERVKDSTDRPNLNGHMNVQYIRELMGKRSEAYKRAADITVATDNRTTEEICLEIMERVR